MTTFYVVAAVLVLVGLGVVLVYNRLVRNRNLVEEAWSGIDVQLRRRADLVPNLVETVKGYAGHERGIFEELAQARSRSLGARGPADQAVAERGMGAALAHLFAVAEAYPDLKADANFRQLQEQLAGIEDQLQMARRYYNGTVRDLNTLIQSVPSNLVAGTFGFKEAEFFELDDEAARTAPQVSFRAAG
jgi:LemA protein